MTDQKALLITQDLLTKVEEIAREAGALALSFKGNTDVHYKDGYAESPVTAGDYAVDEYLREHLVWINPQWGWLSEETVDDGTWKEKDYFWVVDPIDGTLGYVQYLKHGLIDDDEEENTRRAFSISIALVEKESGRPVLGVVYVPQTDQMHAGAEGIGLFLNGKPVDSKPESVTLSDYTFLSSTSEMKRDLLTFLEDKVNLVTMGSSAHKMVQVATGEGRITASVKPKCWWDVAAALCLLNLRGFTCTDLSGAPIILKGDVCTIDGTIAAPQEVYEELFNLLPRKTLAGYE